MSKALETEKEKLESTTITFRIKAKDKETMQLVANEVAKGNITKFIKFAVDHYIADKYGSLEVIRERGADINKYFRDLFTNLAQSEDPVLIQAKWTEALPRMVMGFVQEYERRVKQLQEELNTDLERILTYRIKFE